MRQRKPTIHELRRVAKQYGSTIEVDHDGGCYRATAKDGHRFEEDLHELVSCWCGCHLSYDPIWKAEARKDLLERLLDYKAVEPCDNPDCDWCHDGPYATIATP